MLLEQQWMFLIKTPIVVQAFKECNCISRDNCPMNGLCNLNNVIYQAIIYPKENITDKKLISV